MPHPTIETPETLREFAPHALPADAVARQLGTSPDGLSVLCHKFVYRESVSVRLRMCEQFAAAP